MPRRRQENQPRKIGNHSEDEMQTALDAIEAGKSIRQVSKECLIPFTTLQRYHKKKKETTNENSLRLTPNYTVRKIFTDEQERMLRDYYEKCALLFYGLTIKDCCRVAFEMAKYNNIKIPDSWEMSQMAGLDWLRGFRQRFPDLTLRKPENCSLARATAFNKETVKKFFDNLENVISRNPAFTDGTRIFNLDETATSTVQRNPKVIALKGRRNVCKVSSGEKGTLCTTCNIISAGGHALPPAIVFPRTKVNPRMKIGTPPGSLILASPSGWMNSQLFIQVMKHFIQRSASSKEFPSILIYDNHESHLSIEALDLAKDSGVTVLTLHPHTSAKLQPLDVGIHGPFKTYYASAMESWMMRNPGSPVTIYDVGALIGQAFEKSMTPINIKKSFRKTGICPFDSDIFSEEDFMPSNVTDRPVIVQANPEADAVLAGPSTTSSAEQGICNEYTDKGLGNFSIEPSLLRDIETPSPSIINAFLESEDIHTTSPHIHSTPPRLFNSSTQHLNKHDHSQFSTMPLSLRNEIVDMDVNTPINSSAATITSTVRFITPEEFRKPFTAPVRSVKRKPRRLGRSMIATDTPEKIEIEQSRLGKKKKPSRKTTANKLVRKVLQSDSDEDLEMVLENDSSDEGNYLDEEDNQENIITEDLLKNPLPNPPREGQYVLVEFASKKQKVFYAAKVLEERNKSLELYVSFLRHKKGRFSMPNAPDLAYVKDDNIRLILPNPTIKGSTARQQSYLTFGVDLSGLNIR